jgi:hypothetical protein
MQNNFPLLFPANMPAMPSVSGKAGNSENEGVSCACIIDDNKMKKPVKQEAVITFLNVISLVLYR